MTASKIPRKTSERVLATSSYAQSLDSPNPPIYLLTVSRSVLLNISVAAGVREQSRASSHKLPGILRGWDMPAWKQELELEIL